MYKFSEIKIILFVEMTFELIKFIHRIGSFYIFES